MSRPSALSWLACPVFLLLLVQPVLAQAYALEAPERAHIREELEVQWTLPAGERGLLEIRPVAGPGRRLSYAYTQRQPQRLLAPDAPGDYELVLVVDRAVRASQPLFVVLPEATVDVPARAGAGETIAVTWSGPDSRGDRLTFAARDGGPLRGMSYVYVGNLRGKPGRLRAPADAGAYDVVYVSGSTVLARAPIQVGDVSADLTVPAQVHAGGPVSVRWDGPRNDRDVITFAVRDGAPLAAASYAYVSNHDDNTAVLTASETPGAYDVVYVSSDRVIGRAPIDVTASRVALDAAAEVEALRQFAVTWQGAGNQGDRIDLLDAEGELATYGYVDPNEPAVRLVAPVEIGPHQLVYRSRGGREMARRPIAITTPPAVPGQLLVEQARAALAPDDAVGIILDASGSMLQRLDGERRIAIARDTLTGLLQETLPAGVGFALRVFGHREAGSCRTDLELPLAPLDPARAIAVIRDIEAMNLAKTPLGHSIALAVKDLDGVTGRRILIVVTDGEETCEGDPAAAIQRLRDLGWDIRVNIVGLAIDDPALAETFRAWAALGNGSYFSAADRDALGQALARAATGPYRVTPADSDQVVASGRPGELLTLPAGEYRVRWGDAGTRRVTVHPDSVTRAVLE
jgi:Mg-chelatase subunit ChlD